jgi:TonB-linked SusC/RagA family outer membrane protein
MSVKKYLFLMLSFISITLFTQENIISGTVSDNTGALPGVSIIIKGTSVGTESDFDGKYKISATIGNVLVFRYLGYKIEERTIGSLNVINITMVEDSSVLDEIVVIAYGTSSKEAITGSITQIKSDDIGKRPVANISQVLEGSSPGILVTSPSGQPGSGQGIRIRGFGSFTSSNEPLYVLDGFPINGGLNSVNASDIESVTVLKDASSTALYGNKAANGVVLITTKTGKSQVGELNLNISTGVVTRGNREYDRLGPADYYEAFWESRRNAQAIPGVDSAADVAAANLDATNGIFTDLGYNPFNVPNNQIVGIDGKINPNAQLIYTDLDWEGAISRAGIRKNVDLNFSQRLDKGNFFASMGYLDEKGYILDSDFTRVTARLNANYNAKSWLKLGLNMSGRVSEQNQAQTAGSTSFVNPFRFTRSIGPIYPIYQHDASGAFILDENGNRIFDLDDNRTPDASSGRHILAEILNDNDIRENINLVMKSNAEFTLAEGLTFTTNLSYEYQAFYRSRFRSPLVGDGAPDGDIFKRSFRTTTIGLNQLLNYQKSFNEVHNFELLVGHESQSLEFQDLNANKDEQIFIGIEEFDNFVTLTGGDSAFDELTDESYFGRFNYNFDGKYFFSSSIRTDGSSIYSENTRWGTFYSLGASWSMHKEKFIADVNWINQLKLRASYGEVGNNNVLRVDATRIYYAYQGLLDLGFNNANEAGVVLGSKASPNLKWETLENFDFALEFTLFDNLSGSVEYYTKNSKDLIFAVPLPLSAGGTNFDDSQLQNIGELENSGVEVSLTYDIIKKNDFNWSMTVNASTLNNEFKSLPQDSITNGTKQLKVGKGLFDYYIRDWYGVDPADGSGLFVAEDVTATGVRTVDGVAVTPFSNNARFHYAGTVIPDLFGAVNSKFTYKNFNLDFLFTYQIGGKNLDLNYRGLHDTGGYGGALHADILNRWRQPGDITDIPRNDAVLATQWIATSDRFLHDASFLSLRQINFGYTLPKTFTEKMGMSSFQLYANAENVFNINKRRGLSQQQAFSGNTTNVFEPSRVITFGINVKF